MLLFLFLACFLSGAGSCLLCGFNRVIDAGVKSCSKGSQGDRPGLSSQCR